MTGGLRVFHLIVWLKIVGRQFTLPFIRFLIFLVFSSGQVSDMILLKMGKFTFWSWIWLHGSNWYLSFFFCSRYFNLALRFNLILKFYLGPIKYLNLIFSFMSAWTWLFLSKLVLTLKNLFELYQFESRRQV